MPIEHIEQCNIEQCGYEVIRCPDDLEYGHIEYETLSLCGEYIDCYDQYYLNWLYCPYCGKPFKQKEVKHEL